VYEGTIIWFCPNTRFPQLRLAMTDELHGIPYAILFYRRSGGGALVAAVRISMGSAFSCYEA
jgi:hypothetical protein